MSESLQTRSLGEPSVAEVILGQSPPSSAYNDAEDGLPFFQGKADFGLMHPTPRMWCNAGQKFAKAGDVLMSVRAPVGDVNIATGDCVIGRGIAAVRAGAEVDPWFLYFALLHSKPILEARATGSTFASVNKTTLHELEIPFAKHPEQTAIGSVLRLVVEKLGQEGQAVDTAQELKRATMRELFTRGLRGEAQKDTEIGLVPESWAPRTILELCEIWSGGTPRKSVAEYWSGDIPWVSGKDLKLPALDDAIDHVSAEGVEAASRLAPQGAVLLLVRGMGLAKDLPVAVINRPMAFNQDVKALVSRGVYSGQFLRSAIYAGKDRLLSQIVPSAHGTMTLNLNDVETFKIACPTDPDEAAEIVTILDALDRKIALHRQKRAVLEELFQSLLHKLMTGEICVADLDLSALPPASATA
ncbi:restriction endonuclease subunit S [Thermomonas sp.]|uniref:restriction endonuclease subunit S n=1 Tax=Thermomonas sp. TaxID=1971895 RepID=UPI002BDDEB7E|nr:restriction endonuclease subunit S [Thermomonas sp.]HRO62950.1 restriction endonuclease subunit S [Thermomonas sp.]